MEVGRTEPRGWRQKVKGTRELGCSERMAPPSELRQEVSWARPLPGARGPCFLGCTAAHVSERAGTAPCSFSEDSFSVRSAFYCFSRRWGGGRRKKNLKVGLLGTWERNTFGQVWGRIRRTLSGARRQLEKETEAAVNLARCPVPGLQNPSEWDRCLAPPSLPSGPWGPPLQGWGLLLAWGCLPSFTPPSLSPAGWGPWAWLRPLWPQCEGRAGGTASAFLKINRPQGNQRSRAGPTGRSGQGEKEGGVAWSGGFLGPSIMVVFS